MTAAQLASKDFQEKALDQVKNLSLLKTPPKNATSPIVVLAPQISCLGPSEGNSGKQTTRFP